jgi:hypothetical protein
MADRQNFAPAMLAFENMVSPCSLIPVIFTENQPPRVWAVNDLCDAERPAPALKNPGALGSCDERGNDGAYVGRSTLAEVVYG